MATTVIPHFDMPFRLSPDHPAEVEQDSIEDVTNCVECIVRTTVGSRPELPDFGIEDLTFDTQPLPTADQMVAVAQQEPRVATAWEQEPDPADSLVANVLIKVAEVEVMT